MLKQILEKAGIPKTAIDIYLRLLETGSTSARQLAENLSIPRPSVYDNLKILIKNGLVVEFEKENKKTFSVDDVRSLSYLLHTQSETLKRNEEELARLLPSLQKNSRTIEPKIKFYSGTEGIKRVLNDLLWYKNIETYTMWPISDMVDLLGKYYLENLNRKRIRNNISIKGIWPSGKIVPLKEFPFLGVGKGHLRELRIAPKNMVWNMSYWLYADKVAFISSKKELFGFLIHSHDFAELLKTQFEVIWKLSTPIKPQPQYTDIFLKTV
ncbi:MAG: helix-turn-helix domain-containing protein [Patescibacteria group bacterium]|nr:helix-turn-helix domain-containing protein [Patescibacteria group bacterium]